MAGCKTKRYNMGGKLEMVEKGGKKVPFYAADGKGKMNMGGKVMKYKAGGKATPMKKAPPETALERTSPKSATALRRLKAKQEELAMRNMLRDELGSKLDDPSFRVEMGGKEVQGLKKGGCVGDGCAIRGRTKGRMV